MQAAQMRPFRSAAKLQERNSLPCLQNRCSAGISPRPVNTVPTWFVLPMVRCAVPGAAQCSLLTTAVPFLMTLCAACRAAGHSSPPSARMILSCKSCCIFTRFPHNMKTGPRLYPARRREPFGRVQARAFLFSAFVIFPPASARKPPAARRCTPTRRVRPRRRPAPRPPKLLHRTRG